MRASEELDYQDKMKYFPCAFNLVCSETVTLPRLKTTQYNLITELDIKADCESELIRKNNFLTWIYFRLDKNDDAIKLSNEVIDSTQRNNIAALGNRCFIMWYTGDELEAKKCLDRLKKLRSEENFNVLLTEARAEQAYYYSRLGGFENLSHAIELFSEAVDKTPDNYLWKFGLGLVYRRATHANIFCSSPERCDVEKFKKNAIACLFDVADNVESSLQAMAYAQLLHIRQFQPAGQSLEYDEMFRHLSVSDLCRKALELGDCEPSVLTLCGKAMQFENVDESIRLLLKSVEIKPNSAAYHYLGKSYFKKARLIATGKYHQYVKGSEASGGINQNIGRNRSTGRSRGKPRNVSGARRQLFSESTESICTGVHNHAVESSLTGEQCYQLMGNIQTDVHGYHSVENSLTGEHWYQINDICTDGQFFQESYYQGLERSNMSTPFLSYQNKIPFLLPKCPSEELLRNCDSQARPLYSWPGYDYDTQSGTKRLATVHGHTEQRYRSPSENYGTRGRWHNNGRNTFSRSSSYDYDTQSGTTRLATVHDHTEQRLRSPSENYGTRGRWHNNGRYTFSRSSSYDSTRQPMETSPTSYQANRCNQNDGNYRNYGGRARGHITSPSKSQPIKDGIRYSIRKPRNDSLLDKEDEFVKKAAECFEKAIAIASGNLSAILDLGILLKETCQIQEALRQFNKVTNSYISKDNKVTIINAYEQAGLCYLKLSKTDASDKSYQEEGKKKLVKAISHAADLALTMPELQESAQDLWTAFITLMNEIDRQTPSSEQLKEKFKILELARKYKQIVAEIVDKMPFTGDELINEDIVVTALTSYLKLNQPENALAFQNVLAIRPDVRESTWWNNDPVLTLRIKILLQAISAHLDNIAENENPIVLFQQVFGLAYGTCFGAHDIDDQGNPVEDAVGDVLIVYDDDGGPDNCPGSTKNCALCLKLVNTCLFGLETEENVKGCWKFGVHQSELQLQEMRRYQVVIIVIGEEARDTKFDAMLKCVPHIGDTNKLPKQRILVVDAGLKDGEVPLILAPYPCFKLQDIGGLGNIDVGADAVAGDDRLSSKDILENIFHRNSYSIMKLFCYLIDKSWPLE